jgi:hypothetical protein
MKRQYSSQIWQLTFRQLSYIEAMATITVTKELAPFGSFEPYKRHDLHKWLLLHHYGRPDSYIFAVAIRVQEINARERSFIELDSFQSVRVSYEY